MQSYKVVFTKQMSEPRAGTSRDSGLEYREGLVASKFQGNQFRPCISPPLMQNYGEHLEDEFNQKVTITEDQEAKIKNQNEPKKNRKFWPFGRSQKSPATSELETSSDTEVEEEEYNEDAADTDSFADHDCILGQCKKCICRCVNAIVFRLCNSPETRRRLQAKARENLEMQQSRLEAEQANALQAQGMGMLFENDPQLDSHSD